MLVRKKVSLKIKVERWKWHLLQTSDLLDCEAGDKTIIFPKEYFSESSKFPIETSM